MTNDFRPQYFKAASDFVAKAAEIPIEDFSPEDKHFVLLGWAGVYATLATVPDSVIAQVHIGELERYIETQAVKEKLREAAVKGDLQGAAHEAVTNELRQDVSAEVDADEFDVPVGAAAPHLAVVK